MSSRRIMRYLPGFRLSALLIFGVLLLAVSLIAGSTTGQVTVASSTSAEISNEMTADSFKPAACSFAADLTEVLTGDGSALSSTNDLVLAKPDTTEMSGGDGDDCLIGGPLTTMIDGGPGDNDVCIAGVGTALVNCEHPV